MLRGEERALCKARKGRLMATEIPHAISLRWPECPWPGGGTERDPGR